jgi:oligoendopeptidase F
MSPKKPYSQTRWSLKDLFPANDSPEIEAAFKNLEEKVAEFEKVRPHLIETITDEGFMDIVRQVEDISRLGSKLNYYPNLWFTEDTQNQDAMTLLGRVDQFVAELTNRTLFFNLWWKALSDQTAERLMANSGDYRYWLEEMRHFKAHTLTEPEEKIINLKDVTGSNALITLYEAITNRYTFKVRADGRTKKVTRGELMVNVRSHDPAVRAAAYKELYRVYGADAPILGQIYQSLVRDWKNEQISLRKFSSPISARNLSNDIPDDVVNTLLNVAKKNSSIFQRFFHLKARLIGMERLRRYDIYAPVAKADKQYPFEKATSMVLDSFQEFEPRFAELAERVFAQNHMDSEVRKGKQTGAFCATVAPEVTPWVKLNFQGRADDVSTMAHELGHAIHAMLASQHSLFTFHSSLPMAETASTFGEMMLVDRMLREESDPAIRRDILFRQVDDAYATIQRQSFFAMYERTAHEMIANNASVDDLADAYMKNLKLQFGDAVKLSREFRWEWVSIPHFYNVPFYVYAYAFGQLLVFSLYQQYKKEGDAFKPRYVKILSTGGSEAPVKVLDEAGIDIRKASFWQGGFDVISILVSELEKVS